MSFQNPIFYYRHALREGVVTVDDEATGFPKERLYDEMRGLNFKFGTNSIDHAIDIDQGAAFTAGLNWIVIPEGHNLDGETFLIREGLSLGAQTTLLGGVTVSGTGIISEVFSTQPSAARYLTLDFVGTGQWEIPEIWLTQAKTFSLGPNPKYNDQAFELNSRQEELFTGETFRTVQGPDKRLIKYTFEGLTGTDLTTMQELISKSSNGAFPIYVAITDDTITEPVYCDFIQPPGAGVQDHPNPGAIGQSYTFTVSLKQRIS